jgi:lipid-binding SYLF domain-containing protein
MSCYLRELSGSDGGGLSVAVARDVAAWSGSSVIIMAGISTSGNIGTFPPNYTAQKTVFLTGYVVY